MVELKSAWEEEEELGQCVLTGGWLRMASARANHATAIIRVRNRFNDLFLKEKEKKRGKRKWIKEDCLWEVVDWEKNSKQERGGGRSLDDPDCGRRSPMDPINHHRTDDNHAACKKQ